MYAARAPVQLSTHPGVKSPPGRVDDLMMRASGRTMFAADRAAGGGSGFFSDRAGTSGTGRRACSPGLRRVMWPGVGAGPGEPIHDHRRIPSITGTPVVGNTLIAGGGRWQSPNPRDTFTLWQWWRCATRLPRLHHDQRHELDSLLQTHGRDANQWIALARYVRLECRSDSRPQSSTSLPAGPARPPATLTPRRRSPRPRPPPEPTPAPPLRPPRRRRRPCRPRARSSTRTKTQKMM